MKKITINIEGMHCPSCEMLIADSLKDEGTDNIDISYKKGTATVIYDEKRLNEKKIKDIILKEGYKVK